MAEVLQIVHDIGLPLALFILMMSLGMTLTIANLRDVFGRLKLLLVGAVSMIVLMPSLAFLIAYVAKPDPAIALGLVLVGACPGGLLSNGATSYAKGDVALSICYTAFVSFLAIFTLPIAATIAAHIFLGDAKTIDVPILDTMLRICLLTILPAALGVFINFRFPAYAKQWRDILKNVATGLILLVFLGVLATTYEELLANFATAGLLVLLLNFGSILIGAGIAMLFRFETPSAIAIVMEHAIKQEGLALYVALSIFALPMSTLPIFINSMLGLAFGATVIFLGRRYMKNKITATGVIDAS